MTDSSSPPRTYYLIDGSGYIFRAFHALPMMTRRSDGTPVNAVFGFTGMLIRLLAELKADHLVVVFDAARRNYRNDIYPDYKANRVETPPELVPQFPLIRAAVAAFNVPCVEQEGYEADDLIATYCRLARERGERAVIVSSDKDLMQLIGNGTTMLDPIKNKPIDTAEVIEKFGVPPSQVVDVQALAGDGVDNVPGVPGIGIKTAAQLICDYGDLETLLARAPEIKQPKRRQSLIAFADQARISRRLVLLDEHAPVPLGLDELAVQPPDKATVLAFLRQQEFRSIAARIEAQFAGVEAIPVQAAAPGAISPDAPGDAPPAVTVSYELVQTEAALAAWMARANETGLVAVDTETDSLDAVTCRLVGVSLSTAPGDGCYIPLGHVGANGAGTLVLDAEGGPPPQIPLDRAIGLLRPMLEDPAVLKVGHNLKFDHAVLARHGIRVAPFDDTMLISYVLDGGSHGHGMDELADTHLGHATIKFVEVCGKGRDQITFDRVPLDKALAYAAEDADVTLRLHRALKPRLLAERMVTVYETIERPLPQIVGDMELCGIKVDRAALERLSAEFAQGLERLEGEIHELAGRRFNVGSPKQLGEVLFDEMGLNGGKKSGKTGAWSTDSGVLETFAAQGHDIAQRVLDWRQLAKLKGTYTDALVQQINPATGRVHTSFSLAATNTGRLSSNDPNLQNIPIRTPEGRRIRQAFIAEPGYRLVSVDYSQIELRLVAEIAGIEALKRAFRDGIDIHAMTAAQVFGVPREQVTPELRRRAKTINFGIIYGISGFGLAAQLGIPQGEANAFIRTYLDRFPELRTWMDGIKAFCREHGYVVTRFGRKCHMPGIKESNPARRGFAERQAINAPIQGTAADIVKRAMVRIPRALERAGLHRSRMLLQVHDELVFEAPEAEAAATGALVKRVMEGAAYLGVPLVAEIGIGTNWDEAH